MNRLLLTLSLLVLVTACDEEPTAWELAGAMTLDQRAAEEYPDLHNVFRLSENIISGGEPLSEAALERLAGMGVKTILTVDGKVPDAATAEKYGMRYVHVPIRYKGIPPAARLQIAKTFRELPGPFYVHCFHGKHRGPAAAAWGRLALDGASREQALAEMRQWCGASAKYGGLYETIATAPVPAEDETKKLPWDFPAAHPFRGLRHAMVEMTRTWDNLVLLEKRGFQPDPDHPDIDAGNEAAKLVDSFDRGIQATKGRPEDFRKWLEESAEGARRLEAAVGPVGDSEPGAAAAAFKTVKERCAACHQAYRNR